MDLSELNPVQTEAVKCIDAPVLIFAGAGSGKTRVLTHKIAYILDEMGLPPESILAVTFTNKAAHEMRTRVADLIGSHNGRDGRATAGKRQRGLTDGASGVRVGTFHSICARLLRQEIHQLGYRKDFVIYDSDDQLRLLKSVLEQNDYDLDLYPPQSFRSRISRAKNRMQTPEQLLEEAQNKEAEITAAIYREYQDTLKQNHALDFDDLLLLPLTLFEQFPDVLERYRGQFQYILVDEYQDTNRAQFEFIRQLAEVHQQICVVGDDDQSIYTWRGADITNILNFTRVFKEAKVFKLEQNYRSTSIILEAANAVVARNKRRTEKSLWTTRQGGARIQIYATLNERDEAELVLSRIQDEVLVGKRRFRDMVILYRTNAQSRVLEDTLRRRAIAYTIVGGTKFYDRKEVKDVLAYLRLLINPSDSVSLERIINFPPRAIGETSMNRLRAYARSGKMEIFQALDSGLEAGVQPKQAQAMAEFKALIERYQALSKNPVDDGDASPIVDEYTGVKVTDGAEKLSVAELVSALLEEAGMVRYYRRQDNSDARDRQENIDELISSIDQFHKDNEGGSLPDFLEEVSLFTDIDRWSDDTNAVTLMTLHSAKGLEFPVVFLTGLEEGLFPLLRADDDETDDEEERRLFYVGLTRAQDKAYLIYANQRRRWGSSAMESTPSRFIRELPEALVQWNKRDLRAPAPELDLPKKATLSARSTRTTRAKELAVRSVLDDFVVGAWVEHKIFGKGQISGREGVGDSLKLCVQFSGGQVKKLVARYANLTRL